MEWKPGTTENTEHTEKSLNHTISVWGIKKALSVMLKAFVVNPLGLPGCTGTGFSPERVVSISLTGLGHKKSPQRYAEGFRCEPAGNRKLHISI
ncbi:hypothetical protein [Phaeodactylibacter xiamenensis]|uniref:hypothetical protein n=1 Tax=Phaeodactylibacter xiamenensis TaxID=1524460 RepID=UPI003CCC05DA